VWTGGAISSNKVVITPTLGSDVIVNGDFDTDTDWTKGTGWSISGGVGVASAATGQLYQTTITSGKWYQETFDVSTYTSGSVRAYIGGNALIAYTTTGSKLDTGRAGTTTIGLNDSSFTGSVDNVSVKELTLSSLFSIVSTSDTDVIASTDITATAGTQVGLVTNLNDTTTPTAGIVAYLTRGATDATSKITVDKFTTDTTWTNLTSGTVTYVEGAQLRVITWHSDANTLKVRVYYGGTIVGAEQTITDASIISNTNFYITKD